MNALYFIVTTLFELYLMVVLLRLWLQWARADFYNPMSQFVVKATHPIVGPLRRVIPSIGRFDTATLVLALVVAFLKLLTVSVVFGRHYPLAVMAMGAVLQVFHEFFKLVFFVLILRAILSWVSQGQSPIEYVLYQLTEPFLAPIRRIIPPIGGLDLSILIAILGLQFLQILVGDFIR